MTAGTPAPPAPGAPAAADAVQRCRNCGAPAPDAYCPACGQETRPRLPTIREFAREAAGRYVALDGTLWRTLGALLFRPGMLTREYLAGRRRRYVRPLRLYLAASLACFIVAGLALKDWGVVFVDPGPLARTPPATSPRPTGPAVAPAADPEAVTLKIEGDDVLVTLPDVLKPAEAAVRNRLQRFMALPMAERADRVRTGMRRNAPYAMFVLVPAFALLLKLAYPRNRRAPARPALYGEHLVFAVHHPAFLVASATLTALLPQPLAGLWWAWATLYFVRSLRAVYGGGWPATIARGFWLFVGYTPLVACMVGALAVAAVLLG